MNSRKMVFFCDTHTRTQIEAGTVANGLLTVGNTTHESGTFLVASDTGALFLFKNDVLRLVGERSQEVSKASLGLDKVENKTVAEILAGVATETYVDAAVDGVDGKMGGVMRYKGAVDELPSTVYKFGGGVGYAKCPYQVGDVVSVRTSETVIPGEGLEADDGMNYVCTSVSYVDSTDDAKKCWTLTWDSLGGVVDLSDFASKGELAEGLQGKQDKLPLTQTEVLASGITAADKGLLDRFIVADGLYITHAGGAHTLGGDAASCINLAHTVLRHDGPADGYVVFIRHSHGDQGLTAFSCSADGGVVSLCGLDGPYLFKCTLRENMTEALSVNGVMIASADQTLGKQDALDDVQMAAVESGVTRAHVARIQAISGYGVCSTGSSVAAKTVEASGFVLQTGSRVVLTLTNSNTASHPTLNVSGTGAKNIVYDGDAVGEVMRSGTYDLVYDGTNWVIIGGVSAVYWDE